MNRVHSKKILLEIDEDSFPILFKIKKEELGDLCYNIFENGYKNYFPDKTIYKNNDNLNGIVLANNDKLISKIDHNTDSVKYDIQLIKKTMDKLDIDDKMNKFSQILDDLFGISNNSSKKGKLTEELIYTFIKNKHKNFTIDETRGVPHSGDALLKIPYKNKINKIIIEIKNYSRPVDRDEIDKLKFDMKYNETRYSIILSIKSGFVGKKQLSIEDFNYNNKKYTILFVPYVGEEISKVEFAILLMERLIKYDLNTGSKNDDLSWLHKSVLNHIRNLDELYNGFLEIKNNYFKMETIIKQNLDDFYSGLRNHEFEMKKKINKIWNSINKDFDKAEEELLENEKTDDLILLYKEKKSLGNKNMISILETFKKKQYTVEVSKNEDLLHVFKDDDMLGTLYKSRKGIQIILDEPLISLNISNKNNIKKDIELLNNIL